SVDAVVTDQGVQLQDACSEVDWLGVGTVDNTWNQTCATQATCSTFAEFVAGLSLNYWTLCHVLLLRKTVEILIQVNSVGRRALAKRKAGRGNLIAHGCHRGFGWRCSNGYGCVCGSYVDARDQGHSGSHHVIGHG